MKKSTVIYIVTILAISFVSMLTFTIMNLVFSVPREEKFHFTVKGETVATGRFSAVKILYEKADEHAEHYSGYSSYDAGSDYNSWITIEADCRLTEPSLSIPADMKRYVNYGIENDTLTVTFDFGTDPATMLEVTSLHPFRITVPEGMLKCLSGDFPHTRTVAVNNLRCGDFELSWPRSTVNFDNCSFSTLSVVCRNAYVNVGLTDCGMDLLDLRAERQDRTNNFYFTGSDSRIGRCQVVNASASECVETEETFSGVCPGKFKAGEGVDNVMIVYTSACVSALGQTVQNFNDKTNNSEQ